MQHREHDERWYYVAALATLAVAAAIRFRDLSASFFQDEVWVAELIRDRPWTPHAWLTPPLFYGAAKLWTFLRGTSVTALREPAALFGITLAAAPLFATHLDRATRYLWLFLLAFSSPLLFYSTRLKQYTLEATLAAILIVCFTRAVARESRRAWILFFATALLGVTTLYAPIFIVFAASVAALLVARASLRRTLPWFLATALVFGAAYAGYLAPGPESTRVHGDMDEFFTSTERWMTSPRAVVTTTMHWTGQALNLVRAWWLVFAAAIVAWVMRREDRPMQIAALCVAGVPPVVLAIASAFHYYPYGEVRLMAFAFPGLFLVLASGLSALMARLPRVGIVVTVAFCSLFLWNGVVLDTYNATYMRLHDLRPLYELVARNHRAGEPIFTDLENDAALRYHHPELAADVRQMTPNAPGWFVGRASLLRAAGSIRMQTGDVVAARVP